MGLLVEAIAFVVMPFIIVVLIGIILAEQTKRKEATEKLAGLKESLSKVKDLDTRIIYESYFGEPVDHTGDGFIDGEE